MDLVNVSSVVGRCFCIWYLKTITTARDFITLLSLGIRNFVTILPPKKEPQGFDTETISSQIIMNNALTP